MEESEYRTEIKNEIYRIDSSTSTDDVYWWCLYFLLLTM